MSNDRVQRSLRRGWRNITVGGAWTRRARWYEWRGDEGVSIRLNLAERADQLTPRNRWVEVNLFFDSDEQALATLDRFIAGDRALTLRNEQD